MSVRLMGRMLGTNHISGEIRKYGQAPGNTGIRRIRRTDIFPPFLGGKKCVLYGEKYGSWSLEHQ